MHSDGFKTLLEELKRVEAEIEIKCADGTVITRRKASLFEFKGAHILAYKDAPRTIYIDISAIISVQSYPTVTAAKSGIRHTAIDIPRPT
jgi:hypothetical protein